MLVKTLVCLVAASLVRGATHDPEVDMNAVSQYSFKASLVSKPVECFAKTSLQLNY